GPAQFRNLLDQERSPGDRDFSPTGTLRAQTSSLFQALIKYQTERGGSIVETGLLEMCSNHLCNCLNHHGTWVSESPERKAREGYTTVVHAIVCLSGAKGFEKLHTRAA
ncbi:hypothetical protein STEG23_021669, partial [Scotinomys teguina]